MYEKVPGAEVFLDGKLSLTRRKKTEICNGAFSFANEVPGVFENAKNSDGFVEITKLKPSHRTQIEAECCEECRMLVIRY